MMNSTSRLTCCRKRSKSPSMERVKRCNNLITFSVIPVISVLTSELDHYLIRFSTTILELNLIHSNSLTYKLCKHSLWNSIKIIRCMDHLVTLLLYSTDNSLITSTNRIYRYSTEEIQVLSTILIIHILILTLISDEIIALKSLIHILLSCSYKFILVHSEIT